MEEYSYELDNLYQSLIRGNSVLVLGPELFRYEAEGHILSRALHDNLRQQGADKHILFYDYKDELFYFKEPEAQKRNAVYRGIQRYLSGLQHDALHEKIAQLPFPLIVNLSPDLLLANAFEELNIAHEFRFYHKKVNRDQDDIQRQFEEDTELAVSVDNPLIYNLLGHVDYEESLVLTYRDLFEFLFNVFGRNNLPKALRQILEIQDAGNEKDYIFLGFRFNKWYTQLLLRLLNAQSEANSRMQRYVLGEGMEALVTALEDAGAEDKGFYYIGKYFSLQPIECDPLDILRQLYDRCAGEGKLRALNTRTSSDARDALQRQTKPFDMQLTELLAKNKIREVAEKLLAYCEQAQLHEVREVVVLASAQYEALLGQESKGLLYNNEVWVNRSKVIDQLNRAILQVKQHITAPVS